MLWNATSRNIFKTHFFLFGIYYNLRLKLIYAVNNIFFISSSHLTCKISMKLVAILF